MSTPDYIVTRTSMYELERDYPLSAASMKERGFTGTAIIKSKRASCLTYEVRYDPYNLSFVGGSYALYERFMKATRNLEPLD